MRTISNGSMAEAPAQPPSAPVPSISVRGAANGQLRLSAPAWRRRQFDGLCRTQIIEMVAVGIARHVIKINF